MQHQEETRCKSLPFCPPHLATMVLLKCKSRSLAKNNEFILSSYQTGMNT